MQLWPSNSEFVEWGIVLPGTDHFCPQTRLFLDFLLLLLAGLLPPHSTAHSCQGSELLVIFHSCYFFSLNLFDILDWCQIRKNVVLLFLWGVPTTSPCGQFISAICQSQILPNRLFWFTDGRDAVEPGGVRSLFLSQFTGHASLLGPAFGSILQLFLCHFFELGLGTWQEGFVLYCCFLDCFVEVDGLLSSERNDFEYTMLGWCCFWTDIHFIILYSEDHSSANIPHCVRNNAYSLGLLKLSLVSIIFAFANNNT